MNTDIIRSLLYKNLIALIDILQKVLSLKSSFDFTIIEIDFKITIKKYFIVHVVIVHDWSGGTCNNIYFILRCIKNFHQGRIPRSQLTRCDVP